MKHRFIWAGALALAVTGMSQVQTMAITNGVIFISTRNAQDTAASTEYYSILQYQQWRARPRHGFTR